MPVGVGVLVEVEVKVEEGVLVAEFVPVTVKLAVEVGVAVRVAVIEALGVEVGVAVTLAVTVEVDVEVAVAVVLGVGEPRTQRFKQPVDPADSVNEELPERNGASVVHPLVAGACALKVIVSVFGIGTGVA